jgi:signal transduction histidine kinase
MFSDDGRMKPLDADLLALMFRCVRELMMNIVKHAKARKMTVSLTRREERVFVVVEDDGVGFDMSLPGRQWKRVGFGLFSVRERLSAVGGSYEFQSEPGRGTRITLSVPLKEEMPSS